MPSIPIDTLFDDTRFPAGSLSLVPTVIFFPFGVMLALLRVFIGFHAFVVASILPKSLHLRGFILRCLCAICGLWVTVENEKGHEKMTSPVLVANHISLFDHLAINFTVPTITPSVWAIPRGLAWLLGYENMGIDQGTQILLQNLKRHCNKSSLPVLIFPEGGTTNGAVGLLRFSLWPFTLSKTIQPIALKVKRISLLPIAVSPIGSRWWSDAFWFLFSPYTIFNIKLLETLEKRDSEDVVDFAKRIERTIADSLSLSTTSHTDLDKVEYVKRALFTPPISTRSSESTSPVTESSKFTESSPTSSVGSSRGSQEEHMSLQVQTVLPQVPLSVIRADIAVTGSVDMTITNLLEWKVTTIDSAQREDTDRSVFRSSHFAKNASARELSFKDRKRLMIDTARTRYKFKHGLM